MQKGRKVAEVQKVREKKYRREENRNAEERGRECRKEGSRIAEGKGR